MKIGYARVSTNQQDTLLQTDALNNADCERIYEETYSAKTKDRPELSRMLDALRSGDTVIVWRLDRLGRSLKDLIEILDSFKERNIQFISLTENIDTTSAMGELVFHFIAAMSQFERNLISERTKAGLVAARARGRVGGRKAKLSSGDIKKATAMLADKTISVSDVANHFEVSRTTLYKHIDIKSI
jgi:DNA invertase Pin-like site-specific DNA recombinase